MIICGFPGTGKTEMARKQPIRGSCWVDLESTPFEKNWQLYANVAKHMSENGYNVMTSTHEELLKTFEKMRVKYTVVIPPINDKPNYLKRYLRRGDDKEFIDLIDKNWEKWITSILEKSSIFKTVIILREGGCIENNVIYYMLN